jgi:hypothetical protein
MTVKAVTASIAALPIHVLVLMESPFSVTVI